MNLQPSQEELRLERQQIRAAQEPEEAKSPNPLAAAFGIAAIAALIWSLYVGAEFAARVASVLRGRL